VADLSTGEGNPSGRAFAQATWRHVLFGAVLDGPHLHGLLDRFRTFGLTLVEMRRLPD